MEQCGYPFIIFCFGFICFQICLVNPLLHLTRAGRLPSFAFSLWWACGHAAVGSFVKSPLHSEHHTYLIHFYANLSKIAKERARIELAVTGAFVWGGHGNSNYPCTLKIPCTLTQQNVYTTGYRNPRQNPRYDEDG